MTEPTDGGPAFPNTASPENPNFPGQRDVYPSSGMTLRDWFAGQALAGQLASNACKDNITSAAVEAKSAYAQADAMLAERAKQSTP